MNTINLSLNEDNIILKYYKYSKIDIILNKEKYN